MRVVQLQRYIADDGTEFLTMEEARKRDSLCARVREIQGYVFSPTPPLNSNEYFQHSIQDVLRFKRRLLQLCAYELCPDGVLTPFWMEVIAKADQVSRSSAVGRILADIGGPLNNAWYLIMCIDDQGREWSQPYFVDHPPKQPVERE